MTDAADRKERAGGATNAPGADAEVEAERAAIEAARRGDGPALERLVAENRPRLVRHLIAAQGGGVEEAEEVAQEALARAWQSLEGFDGRSRFYTWLYGIAQHVRLDRRRRAAVRRRVGGGGGGQDEVLAQLPSEREAGPLERLLDAERKERLREALDGLPERQRLALLLRFVDGWSCADIGGQLGTTANGVSMLIFRAKQELSDRLPGEWFESWRKTP